MDLSDDCDLCEGSLSPQLSALVPYASIKRPCGLRSGRCIPVRQVPNTKPFVDFCTINFKMIFHEDSYYILQLF